MKTATQKTRRREWTHITRSPPKWLFGSLFLGGFECSTHRTPAGHRLALIAATQHDVRARGFPALQEHGNPRRS